MTLLFFYVISSGTSCNGAFSYAFIIINTTCNVVQGMDHDGTYPIILISSLFPLHPSHLGKRTGRTWNVGETPRFTSSHNPFIVSLPLNCFHYCQGWSIHVVLTHIVRFFGHSLSITVANANDSISRAVSTRQTTKENSKVTVRHSTEHTTLLFLIPVHTTYTCVYHRSVFKKRNICTASSYMCLLAIKYCRTSTTLSKLTGLGRLSKAVSQPLWYHLRQYSIVLGELD